MKTYPSLRYLISLLGGILVYNAYAFNIYLAATALLVCIILGIVALKKKAFYGLRFFIPLSFLFLGILSSYFYDKRNGKDHILHLDTYNGLLVEIASYTETKPNTFKVTADVRSAYVQNKWEPASGQILLYFDRDVRVFPKYGETYVLRAGMRAIEAPKNPYEFDYRAYQERQNVFHHQFLREGDFYKVANNKDRGLFYWANRANVYTHEVFSQVLDNKQQLGVAEAMIGGMRSELDPETLLWYTKTGAVHALAVSGMHVAILFWVLNVFFGLFLNRKKLPFIITVLILLWSYALFTGLSPSVCRSTLMFTIFQIGVFINRDSNQVNTLLFSALVLLVIVPSWIYDVGFQLSYLAVLGILVMYPYLKNIVNSKNFIVKWLWDVTAVSVAAQVFTLPLSLYYFQQFPNYSLLANPAVALVSIPLLPCGLLLLFFYKIPFLGQAIGWFFKVLIIIMNKCVYWVQSLPNAVTDGLAISLVTVLLLFVLIGFLQMYFNTLRVAYLKWTLGTVVVLIVIGGAKRVGQSKQNELTFHYIPNGLGLSLIQGRSAVFASSDSLVTEPLIYRYHLRNYYNAKGVADYRGEIISGDNNDVLDTKFGKIYWAKSRTSEVPTDVRYVLVSNNSLDVGVAELEKNIVLDGTNHKWYIDKVKEKNKTAVVLYETGSRTIKL